MCACKYDYITVLSNLTDWTHLCKSLYAGVTWDISEAADLHVQGSESCWCNGSAHLPAEIISILKKMRQRLSGASRVRVVTLGWPFTLQQPRRGHAGVCGEGCRKQRREVHVSDESSQADWGARLLGFTCHRLSFVSESQPPRWWAGSFCFSKLHHRYLTPSPVLCTRAVACSPIPNHPF